jgi:hypothetical protein
MSKNLRFGQNPRAKLSIEPQSDRVGTNFLFMGEGFDPRVQVEVYFKTSNGDKFNLHLLTTDSYGNIRFSLMTQGWPWGKYTLVVNGESDGKKVTKEEFFSLTK